MRRLLQICISICRPTRDTKEKFKFEEPIAYIYPFGLGIFATEVNVEAYEEKIFTAILENVEKKVKEEIKKKFNDDINKLADDLSKTGDKNLASAFSFDSNIGKFPWQHAIYWLRVDERLIEKMRSNEHSNLAEIPDRISDLQDRYVLYGWGKSFILTSKDAKGDEDWVEDKVNYLRSVQYVYCSLSLLASSLSKRRMESEAEDLGDISTEAQRRTLKFQIKNFQVLKHASTNYLETFRYDMNELKRKRIHTL
jgi:hypothetical protein